MQLDEFTNREEFQVRGLTETINRLPFTPGKISRSGIFAEEGITKTYIQIEYRENQIKIIPTKPRGAHGERPELRPRAKITIDAVHLPQEDHIDADEIQNIHAFGNDNQLDSLQTLVSEKLGDMRANIDVTHEYQRIGAVNGVIYDADGVTPLLDLFDRFKIEKSQADIDFRPGKLKTSVLKAKQLSEDRLGGYGATGWWALCGRDFMYTLLENSDFNEAYERYNQGSVLREDHRYGINYGDVYWETYRGHVGGVPFIPDNEARLIPLGLRKLFLTKFAPANYNETVNTPGLPYYAKQEMSRFGKGIDFEAQSNPIHLCMMPDVIVHLSIGQTGELKP